MADVGVHLVFFLFGVFFNQYRSLNCCTVLSGKVFLQFLLCYNRTDTLLVTEYFLTSTNVMEVSVCLSVFLIQFYLLNYQEDLHVFRCFACCFFIPCGRILLWRRRVSLLLDVGTVRYVVLHCFFHRVVITVRAFG